MSTCVAIVAASVLVLGLPGWRRVLGVPAPEGVVYAAGEHIDVPAGLHDSAPFTLLVFANANCGACQRARPAMVSLVTALRDRATVRVTMIVDGTAQSDERRYLHQIGLTDEQLAVVDFRVLRLKRVPTTVLVDRTGRILYSLEGEPSTFDRTELLRLASARDASR